MNNPRDPTQPNVNAKASTPGIEKLDLELSISNRLRLSDQLIQPLFGNRAVALVVNVNSVSSPRRLFHR